MASTMYTPARKIARGADSLSTGHTMESVLVRKFAIAALGTMEFAHQSSMPAIPPTTGPNETRAYA